MAGFVRTKRVTDPLDARVRDRLVGSDLACASSGSEHSAAADDDSPCLSELVHGFLEEPEPEEQSDSDSERPAAEAEPRSDAAESAFRWSDAAGNNADSYWRLLAAHAAKAAEAYSWLRAERAAFRRRVMWRLRELGHNAAICKTRWGSSGNLTAGSYEFIDAVLATTGKRYFVDLDFAAEFQIARASPQYTRLENSLPMIFVGDGDDLRRVVRAMCDAARKSMRSTELSLPPWRKNRYMQNKWFGPYRRTANLVPENSVSSAATSLTAATRMAVKCRHVGFDNAVGSDVNVNGIAFVRTR